VAIIYIHKCSKWNETNAGPIERAGFIEAPVIGQANIASSHIVKPIANPANHLTAFLWIAVKNITINKIKVRINSNRKLCNTDPFGRVAHIYATSSNQEKSLKKMRNKTKLASIHHSIWAVM
jgi:hypothetical protein